MVSQELVGVLGSVTTRLRGGGQPGEGRVVIEGLPHYFIAYSKAPIAVGQRVLVINVRGGRQIDVESWDELGRHVVDVPGPIEGT